MFGCWSLSLVFISVCGLRARSKRKVFGPGKKMPAGVFSVGKVDAMELEIW